MFPYSWNYNKQKLIFGQQNMNLVKTRPVTKDGLELKDYGK